MTMTSIPSGLRLHFQEYDLQNLDLDLLPAAAGTRSARRAPGSRRPMRACSMASTVVAFSVEPLSP